MTDQATVREVGLRDGLQLVKRTLPTDIKIEWCQTQAACGFKEMEVTSFVPPKVIPQFADAESVLKAAQSISNMRAAVLVPNLKWGLQALDHGAKKSPSYCQSVKPTTWPMLGVPPTPRLPSLLN